ncbi:MAG: hypothetical protein JNM89_05095 [Hyphomicrobiaceae bacterium]|nr:hypothetical protein [Hyphomicrobiaceae bacterium]
MLLRSVVVVLVILAATKVWTQDRIYRSATEEALIHAYRVKAVEGCQRATRAETPLAPTEQARATLVHAWTRPERLTLVIGNPEVKVSIWEVDHAAWGMRYRYPYLVLDAGSPAPFARCSYDVILDRASVTSL